MAQTTSELWKSLMQSKDTEKEYAFDINGVWYGPDEEVEHSAESALFSEFGFGNAFIGALSLGLYADEIPRGAQIKRFVRLVNGDEVSEWLPKGVFWVNRRAEDDGYWTVEAFDGLRFSEKVWEPDQTLDFPMPMPDAVTEIAAIMGVDLDSRTLGRLNSKYAVDYPQSDQTLRQTLCWIAAAHGGNFVMTDVGELLLVPLLSAPAETHNLVSEHGSAIEFGGVRIIV